MQMETERNLGQPYRKNRAKPKTVTTKLLYKDKGSIQHKNIIFAYIYAFKVGAPNCIKQILTDLGENREQMQ